jgi:hypothetical protein
MDSLKDTLRDVSPPVKKGGRPSAASSRAWVDGLDNLGENLIRLGSSFRNLENTPALLEDEQGFPTAVGHLASVFVVAFRQAHPVLVAGEKSYLNLVPANLEASLPFRPGGEDPRLAHTLVHEAVLASHEVTTLLVRCTQLTAENRELPRKVLLAALHPFTESLLRVGWELREVCHEYMNEVALATGTPDLLSDIGPGFTGLVFDLAGAARRVRLARRLWYRFEARLTAAAGLRVGSNSTSDSFEEPRSSGE